MAFYKAMSNASEEDKGNSFKGAKYLFYCVGIFFPSFLFLLMPGTAAVGYAPASIPLVSTTWFESESCIFVADHIACFICLMLASPKQALITSTLPLAFRSSKCSAHRADGPSL